MRHASFEACLENLPAMLRFVKDALDPQKVDGKDLFQIELAAEEALVNVLRYAYPEQTGRVQLSTDLREERRLFVLVIKDQGAPFNPLKQAPKEDRELAIEEMRVGGWGVGLVQSCTDKLFYHHDGESNILTLEKKLKASA
jgi:anti-sigma regulatory factor (Ser/Thr protein kinase)